jgi:hypothetical protein
MSKEVNLNEIDEAIQKTEKLLVENIKFIPTF